MAFCAFSALYQLQAFYSPILLIPGVLAESRESPPRFLQGLEITDLHDAPAIVGVDAEAHRR
ncbi:hypothetical protein KBY83_01985 [Cyanobium sp. WKJ7-Wakatipu]|uniref:hypothetical protein n=1 Tax=Cyanobium sp. WKJ7-Wakatipu TaxID=2823726 RepID=UPI0020CBDCD9|nr:hypothetical protein [Cyanobium sp. WKJ7-Wakatipu]MCP9782088.1 hypothetical protein [Cyanobium sp. WKJ7-Wakatipu]